jgi:hypothetical protein
MKVLFMVTIMDGALIKGEKRMMKLKTKLHKNIPWTTSLEASLKVDKLLCILLLCLLFGTS